MTSGGTTGGAKGSGTTNLDNNQAKLLGQWIVGQVYPTLIGGQGQTAASAGGNIMNNMPANEIEKLGKEVFNVCSEYARSGHFPNTVSNYSGSGSNRP